VIHPQFLQHRGLIAREVDGPVVEVLRGDGDAFDDNAYRHDHHRQHRQAQARRESSSGPTEMRNTGSRQDAKRDEGPVIDALQDVRQTRRVHEQRADHNPADEKAHSLFRVTCPRSAPAAQHRHGGGDDKGQHE